MYKNKILKFISIVMVLILCSSIAVMAAEHEEYSKEELQKRIYKEAVLIEKEFDDISGISLPENLWADCVIIGGGDTFKVKLYEWVKDEYTITADNGILEITNNTLNIFMKTPGNIIVTWIYEILDEMKRSRNPENPELDNRVIEITVPEDFILDNLNVDFHIGNVKIENCSIAKINMDSNVSDVEINNSKINSINCKTNVGNIVLDNINCETGNIKTNVGDFIISNGTIKNLTAHVNIGNINIKLSDIKKYRVISEITKLSILIVNKKEYTYSGDDSKKYVVNPKAEENKINLYLEIGECIIVP